MSLPTPSFLRLPRASLARRDVVFRLVRGCANVRGPLRLPVVHAFAFKDDELAFARALLGARSQLWLYRTNQRAFAGDFVVVDVSSPVVTRRRAYAVELKRGEPMRVREGTGVQLRNAAQVVAEIAATGVLDQTCRPAIVTGDMRAVLRFFA